MSVASPSSHFQNELEGGETLIPALDDLIQRAGTKGAEEIVIGMAHRGRLNVLVNVLGKSPEDLFSEFEGRFSHADQGSGDVKYHMGFSSDIETDSRRPRRMLHTWRRRKLPQRFLHRQLRF